MQSYVAFGLHDDSLTIVNDYGNLKKIELNLHGGPCQDLQKDQELLQIIIPTK